MFTLAVFNGLAWYEVSKLPDGRLHLHFLDIGQGDATLIQSPGGKTVLIDGGRDLRTLEHLGTHLPFFQRHIDLVVLTHPDGDHLTSLPEVLRRYDVGAVLLAGSAKGSDRYRDFLHEVTTRNIRVIPSLPGNAIHLGDGAWMEMLWPESQAVTAIGEANNASVTLLLHYGASRVLLPGDIEEAAERELLATGADVRAPVLKVPHHGSRTSSSTGFLLAVQPDLAIVSAGADNPYGHPHPDVLQRYENLGIEVRSTAKDGTISLTLP